MDARKRRSREKLTKALCTLLATKPLEMITIDEITKQAGVTRQTFYSNYDSKHAVLLAYMEQWQSTLMNLYEQGVPKGMDSQKQMAYLMSQSFAMFGEDVELRRAIISGRAGHEILNIYRKLVVSILERKLQDDQQEMPSEDQRLFALFSAFGVTGVTDAWSKGEFDLTAEALAEKLSDFTHRGLNGQLKQREGTL